MTQLLTVSAPLGAQCFSGLLANTARPSSRAVPWLSTPGGHPYIAPPPPENGNPQIFLMCWTWDQELCGSQRHSRRLDCSGVKCLYTPRIPQDSKGREGPREEKRLLLVLFEPGVMWEGAWMKKAHCAPLTPRWLVLAQPS